MRQRQNGKHILRECFESYLPASVAWRQKEQFSDGVGYSWIDTLKEVAAKQISDQQLETASFRFPYNTPGSKEAYLYRGSLKSCSRCRALPSVFWRSVSGLFICKSH